MKTVFSIAITGIMMLSGLSAEDDELSVRERARGMGVYWWVVEIPKQKDSMKLRFVVKYADGTTQGLVNGEFQPGAKVKVLCWESDDRKFLNASLISARRTRRSRKLKNPFLESKIQMYIFMVGETVNLGDFIVKGSTGDGVSDDRELKQGEWGLMVEKKK